MTFIIAKEIYGTRITFYDTPKIKSSISAMINDFSSLWQDIESVKNVPESKWMNISLFDNWRELYKSDQTRIYPLDQKNKNVIDKKFDKLHAQDRIKWIVTTTFFFFSYFIIWKTTLKERKKRMIINIRALNKIIILNVYLVFSQADILIAIKNIKFISTIDAASFFYQW